MIHLVSGGTVNWKTPGLTAFELQIEHIFCLYLYRQLLFDEISVKIRISCFQTSVTETNGVLIQFLGDCV